jgi:hypothetical protein
MRKVGLSSLFLDEDGDEFGLRANKIELLQKNLEILKDEFYFNPNIEAEKLLKGFQGFGNIENGDAKNGNVPGIGHADPKFTTAFQTNDVQISKIGAEIAQKIPMLKDKMENVHLGVLQQSENLKRLSKRDVMNYKIIRETDNSLKQKLYKIRHGRKAVCDLCLIIFLVGLISIIVSIASTK